MTTWAYLTTYTYTMCTLVDSLLNYYNNMPVSLCYHTTHMYTAYVYTCIESLLKNII